MRQVKSIQEQYCTHLGRNVVVEITRQGDGKNRRVCLSGNDCGGQRKDCKNNTVK